MRRSANDFEFDLRKGRRHHAPAEKKGSPPSVGKTDLTQRRKAAKERQIESQPVVAATLLGGFAPLRETFPLFGGEPKKEIRWPTSRWNA
jgi:hypothetical protein